MSRRVLCKFFIRGTCLKGEYCGYSHQLRVPPNNICNFYRKGTCTYGDRCRYAHTEVFEVQSPALSESDAGVDASVATEISGVGGFEFGESSGCKNMPHNDCNDDDISSFYHANQSLCPIAANGECQLGEEGPQLHGDRSEALQLSQEQIECNVCLDRILSKRTAEERKFGILSGCDHAFCVMCIRSWRKRFRRSASGGNSPARTCPVCRRFSFFVIPSNVWYTTREEKMEIIDNYKAKLRSIDCKHFDFGNGTCPFRTNCFYKHTVQPGSLLWNAAMGQDVYKPRVQALRSHNFNIRDFLARFNNPNPPVDSEELENGNDDDFDDLMSEIRKKFSTDDEENE